MHLNYHMMRHTEEEFFKGGVQKVQPQSRLCISSQFIKQVSVPGRAAFGRNKGITSSNGLIDSRVPHNFCYMTSDLLHSCVSWETSFTIAVSAASSLSVDSSLVQPILKFQLKKTAAEASAIQYRSVTFHITVQA